MYRHTICAVSFSEAKVVTADPVVFLAARINPRLNGFGVTAFSLTHALVTPMTPAPRTSTFMPLS